VRYDVNAVYLGTPGANQNCPAHAIGKADTLSIGAPLAPGELSTPANTTMQASVGAKAGGADLPATPGTILQNPQTREYGVSMPSSAPPVHATTGPTPA
jgi:hypothetical protein